MPNSPPASQPIYCLVPLKVPVIDEGLTRVILIVVLLVCVAVPMTVPKVLLYNVPTFPVRVNVPVSSYAVPRPLIVQVLLVMVIVAV